MRDTKSLDALRRDLIAAGAVLLFALLVGRALNWIGWA
jgi:hypothetical protein